MNTRPTSSNRSAWTVWIYSGVLIAAGLAQMLRKILDDTGGFGSRYAGLILAMVITVGLFARSRGRAVGPRWIWRLLLWALAVVFVAVTGLSIMLALERSWTMAGWLLGGVAALAPGVFWLWDYGYRSAELWTSRDSG